MKLKILLTYGRTRSYIDAIRYITNNSSGLMGQAIHRELLRLGHQVTAITSDVDIADSTLPHVYAKTNQEAWSLISEHLKNQQIIIILSAFNDYEVRDRIHHKINKTNRPELNLTLNRNMDIIENISLKKTPEQLLVGFSAQNNLYDLQVAMHKKQRKNIDVLVVNSINSMGKLNNKVNVLNFNYVITKLPEATKNIIASELVQLFLDNYLDGKRNSTILSTSK